MQRRLLVVFIVFIFPFIALAQTAVIKGTVQDESKRPVANSAVTLKGTYFSTTTDSTGSFSFSNVPFRTYTLEVSGENISTYSNTIEVKEPKVDLGTIATQYSRFAGNLGADNIPEVSLSDDELNETTTQTVSSALTSTHDVFISAASYAFSISRFRIRGYDNTNEITLMNGAVMEDLNTERSLFSFMERIE